MRIERHSILQGVLNFITSCFEPADPVGLQPTAFAETLNTKEIAVIAGTSKDNIPVKREFPDIDDAQRSFLTDDA
jgi:hypothetical protein